jgi:hypothetical protein
MSTTFATQITILPGFTLSVQSQEVLQTYLATGNRAYKEKKLSDFFKTLDWLTWEELDWTPLSKLSLAGQQLIQQDIKAFYQHKANQQQAAQAQRQNYQARVMAYYREHLSPADKSLLESLRDFELDQTGRDVNWQHHFALKSFKRIDAFAEASHTQRVGWIAAFQEDVLTYIRNRQKWETLAAAQAQPHSFNFDDWCEWFEDDATQTQNKAPKQQPPKEEEAHAKARKLLGLDHNQTDTNSLKRAFRQKTLAVHPDMPGGSTTAMREVLQAYETLKNTHS